MHIYHVVYDYALLLKIAGPNFAETYWNQFEGDGVESMIKIPDMFKCNANSMNEFEEVRHVAENWTWPLWLSGIYTQESDIKRILRSDEATEMIDALWDPAVVGNIVASYYSSPNPDDELKKFYNAICLNKYSSGSFACFQDFSDYVDQWLRPWVFAEKNGYAIGYQSG